MCTRRLIRSFDAFLRRCFGIVDLVPEQSDPACLLRVRVTRATHAVSLPEGPVAPGAQVLELHLWNERIPPIPPGGPDMAWARQTQRMFLASLREAARQLREDTRLAGVQAVTGTSVLVYGADGVERDRLMQWLGFSVFPARNPLGPFGQFWEIAYTWSIMWTYNAASLRTRRLRGMRRDEFWMARSRFLERFGR
jgi:YkoP domain